MVSGAGINAFSRSFALLFVAVFAICPARAQHNHQAASGLPHPAVTLRETPLRGALTLIREGKTREARQELEKLQRANPDDPEILFQIGRTYLLDFNTEIDVTKRRIALNLAMENLGAAIAKDPNHIPSLRAKAIIHARAELLHYDPDLAYEYASRVAKAEPHASEYLLTLTDWMSGEVRFTGHGDHRVPHDPLLGLDRSIAILDQLLDHVMPFSNEETAAYFQMGKTLSRRGNFQESIPYLRQALARAERPDQKTEALRELGAAYYRLDDFPGAARNFYESLQWSRSDIDRWLLKTAIDQMPGPAPSLAKDALFPAASLMPENGQKDTFAFKDIAPELGLNRLDGNGTCSWADFDGDGDLDLFLAGAGTNMALFRNDGKTFTEVTEQAGLQGVPSGYSLNLVDYDNDGDPDLYISLNGWSGPLGNRLYRNTDGRFEDVTERSGAGDEGDGFVSLWGDLDNDGWLDLVVTNGVLKDGSTPQLYRNNRDGTFSNVTKAAGIDEPPTYGGIGAALGDYDKDGDLDIFFNGLENAPNRLYRNDGAWKFIDVTKRAGVGQAPHNGFVAFFVDYDNDTYPDLLTTSLAPWDAVIEGLKSGFVPQGGKAHPDSTRLFRNNRNGTFSDVTFAAGLYFPMGTMGAGVADLDNDGYIDFYAGTGDPQLTRLEPNRVFHNNGDGTFSDWTDAAGFARPGNKGHGITFVDIDSDGDLDVYAQLGGHYPGDWAKNAFYRNERGNRNTWLQVKLEGRTSNRSAVGAQVTLTVGLKKFYRELKGGEGFGSTNPLLLHFGLGDADTIDHLEVVWPSGGKQEYTGIAARQSIRIVEGAEAWTKIAP